VVFLTLMVIGLTGLVMMAIPAFIGHGHAPPNQGAGHEGLGHHLGNGGHGGHGGHHLLGPGHGAAHAVGTHVAGAHAAGAHVAGVDAAGADAAAGHDASLGDHGDDPSSAMVDASSSAPSGITRFIPSPRTIFSLLALYGAFGNALAKAANLPLIVAALVAVLPALAIERFAVTPLWNLLFRFQGKPSSPLAELLFAEAKAVTPFRNGRGLVSIVRDGRLVQFSARLREDQAALPVRVGERLRIEDVDAEKERFTVSLLRE
jgi:hypothetical protein